MKAEPDSRVVKGKDVKVRQALGNTQCTIDVQFSVDDFEKLGWVALATSCLWSADPLGFHLGMVHHTHGIHADITDASGVRGHEAKAIMRDRMKLGDKVWTDPIEGAYRKLKWRCCSTTAIRRYPVRLVGGMQGLG
jgi:hypothetical protein